MSIQNEPDTWIGDGLDDHFQTIRLRQQHTTGKHGALGGDMTIEALPTCHAGVTFRSALEAGWARTLDSLDIQWRYEPKTVTLPSGARYIPDFWLPEHGIWLEVKGTGVPRVEKAIEFGVTVACRCGGSCTCDWPGGEMVIIGHPPKRYDPHHEGTPAQVSARRAWRHGGHPVWSTTSGYRPWITRCPHCNRGGWSNTPYCRVCSLRPCSWKPGLAAYFSGAPELEFRAVSGPAAGMSSATPITPQGASL